MDQIQGTPYEVLMVGSLWCLLAMHVCLIQSATILTKRQSFSLEYISHQADVLSIDAFSKLDNIL